MPDQSRPYIALQPGEAAPWFRQRSGDSPYYAFDAAAGRYLVLCFFAASEDALGQGALNSVRAERALFDDERFSFFGVTMDRRDDSEKRVATELPGIRYLFDFDGTVGKLYGALPDDMKPGEAGLLMRRFWVVVGPSLRVMRIFAFEADGSEQPALFAYLKSLPPLHLANARPAPVIVMDTIFEPEFCRGLVALCEKQPNGGDCPITEKNLVEAIQIRMQRRILPEVLKAYQFAATRMENYAVTRLAQGQAPPPAQRDNSSRATAHRRFSVAIGLNDDYEGGALQFPEYGEADFRPAVGGACIFSSSLLHRSAPVARGSRYIFSPFLYDDAAASIRAANGGV